VASQVMLCETSGVIRNRLHGLMMPLLRCQAHGGLASPCTTPGIQAPQCGEFGWLSCALECWHWAEWKHDRIVALALWRAGLSNQEWVEWHAHVESLLCRQWCLTVVCDRLASHMWRGGMRMGQSKFTWMAPNMTGVGGPVQLQAWPCHD